MLFAWDDVNREHIAKHGVSPEEAEEVVRGAAEPFPEQLPDGKWVVWGPTGVRRHLQVIFVPKSPQEVPYESLTIPEWMAVEAGDEEHIVRVVHAMPLTPRMKKRLRRRWR